MSKNLIVGKAVRVYVCGDWLRGVVAVREHNGIVVDVGGRRIHIHMSVIRRDVRIGG